MILAPFGMLGLQSWEATEIPEVFKLCIKLGRETLAVGSTLGYTIEPIFGLSAAEFMGSADEIVEKLLVTIVRHHGETARKVREKGLLQQVEQSGAHLIERARALARTKESRIAAVRGRGLLVGIEIKDDAAGVVSRCRDAGLLVNLAGERTVRFAPPLTVSLAELDEGLELFARAL